jgi:uncharacterized protein
MVRIALFPLRTVLFPQGLLPLRIFETRYVDMIRSRMREGEGFGVVLISSGAEVGGIVEVASIGTWARVVDFGQMPDGLLKIVARGERRFRILGRDLQPDGLHLADVEWLDESPEEPLAADEFTELRAALANVLPDLGEEYPVGEEHMEDASWFAGHLCQLLPVPAEVRQGLLELASARHRLGMIEKLSQTRTAG